MKNSRDNSRRRHNRLLITYNESLRCPNIIDDYKESFRVKKFTRASEIVGQRAPGLVKKASWIDAGGMEHHLVV